MYAEKDNASTCVSEEVGDGGSMCGFVCVFIGIIFTSFREPYLTCPRVLFPPQLMAMFVSVFIND